MPYIEPLVSLSIIVYGSLEYIGCRSLAVQEEGYILGDHLPTSTHHGLILDIAVCPMRALCRKGGIILSVFDKAMTCRFVGDGLGFFVMFPSSLTSLGPIM